MSDSKGIAQEAISDLSQTGTQVVKEAASVVTSMPGSILQQIAGTPSNLKEAKAEQLKEDAVQIRKAQSQLAQHIQAQRQVRGQMEQARQLQDQQAAEQKSLATISGNSSSPNIAHKLTERRADKRQG